MLTAEEQAVLDKAAVDKAAADAAAAKVEFTEVQQTAIGKIFDTRFGKINAKHETEKKAMADQNAALQAELDALKASKGKGAGSGDDDARQNQIKEILANEKSQTAAAKAALEASKTEAAGLHKEILRTRKEIAIQNATAGRFLDMEAVQSMTENKIEWDEDTKAFIVRENGIVRQNSSLQNMTLAEYFEEFGKKRPFLVRSDVVGGAGSSENAGSSSSALGIVRTKADLQGATPRDFKKKSDYITKFGLAAFEALPIK